MRFLTIYKYRAAFPYQNTGKFSTRLHESSGNTFRKHNKDSGVTSLLKCSEGKQLMKSGRTERKDDDVIHTFYQTAQSLETVSTKQKNSLGPPCKAGNSDKCLKCLRIRFLFRRKYLCHKDKELNTKSPFIMKTKRNACTHCGQNPKFIEVKTVCTTILQ